MSGAGQQRQWTTASWQRRVMANFQGLVKDLTSLASLTDHLISAFAFSPHDADFVENGGPDRTQMACNRRFLTRLLEKGMWWWLVACSSK